MPQLTTDGPSPLIAGLAILVVAGAGIYLYHMQLERTHEKLQSQIAEANRQIASMMRVKQAYLERQKDYDAFKRRFDIIDQLRASQGGPVAIADQRERNGEFHRRSLAADHAGRWSERGFGRGCAGAEQRSRT